MFLSQKKGPLNNKNQLKDSYVFKEKHRKHTLAPFFGGILLDLKKMEVSEGRNLHKLPKAWWPKVRVGGLFAGLLKALRWLVGFFGARGCQDF